jgi:hypothetical protein
MTIPLREDASGRKINDRRRRRGLGTRRSIVDSLKQAAGASVEPTGTNAA